MKNNMNKLAAGLAACMLAISVTACQAQTEMVMTEYTSSDGTYSVTMPEGMAQSDMMGSVMMLDGTSNKMDLVAIAYGDSKSAAANGNKSITTLAEFGDYFESIGGFTSSWDSETEKQQEGLVNCVLKEGSVKQNGVNSDALMFLGESEKSYCGLVVLGKKKTLNNVKEKISITSLGGAEKTSVVDYIDGMKAVLDTINGGNILQAAHSANQLYEEADEAGKKSFQAGYDQMRDNARQALSESWGITDKESLFSQKDELLTGGHNQEALEILAEYDTEGTADREAFVEKTKADGLSESETAYILAAYDAKAAFGDNAIKAWDLSRIPTIMGMGYAAGYCTYEEALDGCLEAAKLAQQSFDSWKSFNQSYLYGYAYWSEESLEDQSSSAYERQQTVETLENEENGPFSVDWNLTLEKEW